ncbi:MAG: Crp/Fnr family transcriptional regulator [Burkholderiales bacterium]
MNPATPLNGSKIFSRTHSARCTASDVLNWSGMQALVSGETDRIIFSMRRVLLETPLVHEGQAVEYLYCVGAGSFKTVQTDLEGYEQVLGFCLHGDTIGLDGLCTNRHASGAIALEDSTVAVLPFRDLLSLSRKLPAIEQFLHQALGSEMRHRSETQYLMSASSSEVRVARFLLHFSQRQNALGLSDRRLRLRMCRRDIASCLGLAHETVSRALTALAQAKCITVSNRDIEIIDAVLLHALQRATRGGRPVSVVQKAGQAVPQAS